jgi:zinc-binding alcohol dehydrogenase/oxidoreductase
VKAAVLRAFGEPDVVRVDDAPDPVPGPGEAVVRLRAAAFNHRDVWIRRGLYSNIRLPVILGSDGAGEVAAVGDGVDRALLGTPVVINPSLDWGDDERAQGPAWRILGLPEDGTHAQLVKVPASSLFPKPAALTWHEAAALPLAGLTAYRALVTRANVQAGETVVVTGIGGGVATFALAIARALGARVWVTSGSDAKLARASEIGAAGGVNYRRDGWATELAAMTGGGPDVIVDGAGGETFAQALAIARPGGRIVSYGATSGSPSTIEVRRLFWKQLTLLGSTMGTPREFAGMLRLYQEGRLRPVVDCVLPLGDVAEAHRRMEAGEQFGKIVLDLEPGLQ